MSAHMPKVVPLHYAVPAAPVRWLISFAVEPLAAAILVIEFLILLCGAVARYAFNSPLPWVDEIAGLLFLWLAILGATIALQRGEHMRLTLLLRWVAEPTRLFLETFGMVIVLALAAMLLPRAVGYTQAEWLVRTPALDLPDGIRGLALPVGMALFILVGCGRLHEEARLRHVLWSVALVGAIALLCWLGRPVLIGMGKFNLVFFFVAMVGACVAVGVPIGFAFGVATTAYLLTVTRFSPEIVISRMDEGMSQLILLSIPLFVLLGGIMQITSISRALIEFLATLLCRVKGGLHFVLIGAMYLVSGISGSKAADMAAVAPMLLPEMRRRGIPAAEAVALLSAAGAQTETIPPSFVLIVLGSTAGISVGALFTGGLLPAAIAGLVLAGVCAWKSRREDLSALPPTNWAAVWKGLLWAAPALVLPFLIRGCVVQGVATATEVASIGIVYCVLAGVLVYGGVRWDRLYPMLVETASLGGAIMLILGLATAMAWALTQAGFSRSLAAAMIGLSGGPAGFMAISIMVFIILGSLLEGVPAIVLFAPLLFPISRSLGIHDIHYAMVAVMSMGIGLFTPPFGVGFYAACAIGQAPPDEVIPRVWPYLAALLVALGLVAAFPWLSTGFL